MCSLLLTDEEEANCVLCDSPGDLLDQLFCTSCGLHYHGMCLDISVTPLKRAGWQCPECKVCQTCKWVAAKLCLFAFHAVFPVHKKFFSASLLPHMFTFMCFWSSFNVYSLLKHKYFTKVLIKDNWFVSFRELGEDTKMLVCDMCDKGYHTYCLQPAMDSIPTNGWRCKVQTTLNTMKDA